MRSLTRDEWARVVIGAACVATFAVGVGRVGLFGLFGRGGDDGTLFGDERWIGGRWLFCFFHANVFHLLGNMVCLWLIKCRWWWWIVGYAVSVVCTFLPCPVWSWRELGFVSMPSCGLSGVLMAVIGMLWGTAIGKVGFCKWLSVVMKWVALPVIVTGLLPNMNALMHVWCFIGGAIASLPKSVGRLKIKDEKLKM